MGLPSFAGRGPPGGGTIGPALGASRESRRDGKGALLGLAGERHVRTPDRAERAQGVVRAEIAWVSAGAASGAVSNSRTRSAVRPRPPPVRWRIARGRTRR